MDAILGTHRAMRSDGQLCALAKALDVIGDRWSLLIVRELLPGRPCRYTDLQHGLPGIATNMLAERLRQLEQAGIITREYAPPPVATTVYTLTERGRELLPVIRELGRWGAPLLAGASDDDTFRSGWMALQFDLFYYDPSRTSPPSPSRSAPPTSRWSLPLVPARSMPALGPPAIRT